MADLNAGGWIFFENNGVVKIGSDAVLNIVPGSVRWRTRNNERIQNMDRGTLGVVTIGAERPQEIEFAVYRTTNTNALVALMRPAPTAGYETYFTCVIEQPSYRGATAGQRWTFNKCYMPDGEEAEPGDASQAAAQVVFRFVHAGPPPTPEAYT